MSGVASNILEDSKAFYRISWQTIQDAADGSWDYGKIGRYVIQPNKKYIYV